MQLLGCCLGILRVAMWLHKCSKSGYSVARVLLRWSKSKCSKSDYAVTRMLLCSKS